MEEDNLTNKRTAIRSTSYPAIDVKEAIILAEKLKSNLGVGPYSRADAAVAIGYSGINGLSAVKIAALTHYGLLTRVGNTYRQSALSERILHALSEEEKAQAIVEATKTPRLYSSLIEKYKGSALPSMLHNILIRDHKISEKVSNKVVADFKLSLEYAGLLKNGVIVEQFQSPESDTQGKLASVSDDFQEQEEKTDGEKEIQTVELSLENGKARLIVPKELTENDAKKLRAQINILANIFD